MEVTAMAPRYKSLNRVGESNGRMLSESARDSGCGLTRRATPWEVLKRIVAERTVVRRMPRIY